MTKIQEELDKLKGQVPINYHLLHRKNLSASKHQRVMTPFFYKPIGRVAKLDSYYTPKKEEDGKQ